MVLCINTELLHGDKNIRIMLAGLAPLPSPFLHDGSQTELVILSRPPPRWVTFAKGRNALPS